MNVKESCDVNYLLGYLLGHNPNGSMKRDRAGAIEAAAALADKANKTLSAGLTGDRVRALWAESGLTPSRKLKGRRP
jgi:hypothetical protein